MDAMRPKMTPSWCGVEQDIASRSKGERELRGTFAVCNTRARAWSSPRVEGLRSYCVCLLLQYLL
jgi:hypothetical protein